MTSRNDEPQATSRNDGRERAGRPGMSPSESDPKAGARLAATRMSAAAVAWLEALDAEQRRSASRPGPEDQPDGAADAERRRWFYTPADHGGLTMGAQRPAQQSLAMQVVASGLSRAAYVTVATVMGLENVLDAIEGWSRDWGWERGRDPSRYWLRIFGDPSGSAPWGWRFGGHHVSLNYLVVDGAVAACTPCFLGADPAVAPLLGGAVVRPLAAVEELARELVTSLDAEARQAAVLLPRAPTDIVAGNRSRVGEGDRMMVLADSALWGKEFTEPRLRDALIEMSAQAEEAAGLGRADHDVLALTARPKGLPGARLDDRQRELLRALLDTYIGRVPDELRPTRYDEQALDQVHVAWAGDLAVGAPHYYRLQGPRLLIEYDNVQRGANHAHSVWRDPEGDFGADVLAEHRAAHHREAV
jgi:hypothetical protein